LSNFAALQLKDRLARLPGVGDVTFLGEREYSMRIWLDPEKLARLKLSAGDVVKAIREQNVQIAAGALGQNPVPKGEHPQTQLTITAKGRLLEEEEFANIVVKRDETGQVYLRNVVPVDEKGKPRIELGAKNYDVDSNLAGVPSVTLAVYQL